MQTAQILLRGVEFGCKHADWDRACELIENCDWDSLQGNDVNESWVRWSHKFVSIMEECIPRKTLCSRKNLPWLSKKLVQSMRKRNHLYRLGKVSGDFSKYKHARNKTVTLLRNAERNFFKRLNPKKSKDFWRAVKYLRKSKSVIPSLVSNTGTPANTSTDKANMLNQFFSQCFNHSCLLYTSPSPRDATLSRMPSSA